MAKKLLLTPRDVMEILGITKDRYYKTIYRLLEPAQLLKLILDKQKEKDHGKKTPTHT